jgi:tetratricopeptide (TPR) repeat protein
MQSLPRLAVACAPLLALATGCASTPDADPRYRPAENVLEVIAVLRRHVPDDTYRFEAARDFTGRNVYRSSLLRLESLESIHSDALRSGYMDGAIAFAKGRALERLRAYDLAAEEYRLAAEIEAELKVEALRSADLCDGLHRAAGMTTAPEASASLADTPGVLDARAVIEAASQRDALLETLERSAEGTHHVYVVQEEMERADIERAGHFVGLRTILPDGDVRAASELQQLAMDHSQSKNASRHLLALAGLYEDMAVEYINAHPPESLLFDPVRFQELIDTASRLFETVAGRDGTPEKLEASRKLEAFLAFALRVDRDRFTP